MARPSGRPGGRGPVAGGARTGVESVRGSGTGAPWRQHLTAARQRADLGRFGESLAYWAVVGFAFAVSLVHAQRTTLMAAQDSMHYYARALLYAGTSRDEAFALVTDKSYSLGWNQGLTPEILFDWDLVRPRVVYPALATPFVKAFGWSGMTLTSIALAVVLYALMAWVLRRRFGTVPALAALAVVFGCQAWFFYAVAPLTEGLSALTLAGMVGAAWLYRRARHRRRWLYLVAAGVLAVVFAFTRQAQLIAAGAFSVVWVGEWIRSRRARNSWLAPSATVVGVSAATQVYQLLVYPFDQLAHMQSKVGGESFWETLAAAPYHLYTATKFDFRLAVEDDPGMAFAMFVLLGAMIYCWRRPEIHLACGAVLAGMIYQGVNGSIRLEFRYLEPGLFLYALAGAAFMAALARRRMTRHQTW